MMKFLLVFSLDDLLNKTIPLCALSYKFFGGLQTGTYFLKRIFVDIVYRGFDHFIYILCRFKFVINGRCECTDRARAGKDVENILVRTVFLCSVMNKKL